MVKVTGVPQRNQLHLVVSTVPDEVEFERFLQDIRTGSEQLQPGWIAAVDLRGLTPRPGFGELVARTQQLLLDLGATKIATLVDSPVVTGLLSRTGKTTRVEPMVQRFIEETAWRAFLDA